MESIGINISTLNTATLGVFGQAGGMLPEANATNNYDDITELALYRFGLDDGSFDDGDYILFYGMPPNKWNYNSTTGEYKFTKHIYSNLNYYFITTNRGTFKTITNQPNSASAPNQTSNSYDYNQVWDNDVVNLINSGRQWFDTPLDNFSNAKTYSATIANIKTSETAYIRYFLQQKAAPDLLRFQLMEVDIPILFLLH